MKKGDSIRVKKQQTRTTVDYLKSNNIKPLSQGTVISVAPSNGITYVMVEMQYNKVISLPENAVESAYTGMFDGIGGMEDAFGSFADIFGGKKK